MRFNEMHNQSSFDVSFDYFITTPTGELALDPDLTTHISGTQWQSLYDGMAFALRRGMVMNVHVTIVWPRLGVYAHNEGREFLEDFCDALQERAKRQKWPLSYAYAHERSRDEGFHTHLLTLWPYIDRAGLNAWVKRYFAKRSRLPYDPAAVDVRHKKDNNVARHWAWFGYITKGAYPEFVCRGLELGDIMRWHHEYQGVVGCRKRVGVSRNIDRTARQRAEFRSNFQRIDRVTKEILYTDEYLHDYENEKRMAEVKSTIFSLFL
jgi:hypothetical protein